MNKERKSSPHSSIVPYLLAAILVVACATFIAILYAHEGVDRSGGDFLAGANTNLESFVYVSPDGADTIASGLTGKLKVVSTSANDIAANISLTVYAHNSTSYFVETITGFNNTEKFSGNTTWTQIDKLVLNRSSIGTVTVSDNATGTVLATFSPGETVAYNAAVAAGSDYFPSVSKLNASSDWDLSRETEYKLYVSCDGVAASNVTFAYYVSPDGSKWFTGATSVPQCNGTSAATTLADVGVYKMRFEVNNADARANKLFVKLIAK